MSDGVRQRTCSHCGGSGFIDNDDDDAIEAIVSELHECCADLNIAIGLSGTVCEGDAARLLGRARATLANWRYGECPITFVKLNGRVRYRLHHLAKWVFENQS